MNHNIVNKILYKVWLEGIKQVNKEYHKNYVYCPVTECEGGCLLYYPYVLHKTDLSQYGNKNISEITSREGMCVLNLRHPTWTLMPSIVIRYKKYLNVFTKDIVSFPLPYNYIYSSGLNHKNGYKDN